MYDIFIQTSAVIIVIMAALWLISIFIKNVSIVDLFWGAGFIVTNAVYFYLSDDPSPRKVMLLIMVSIWGARLSLYLTWRNYGKGEDYRYREFRKKYGEKRYWWFSFFQTFLLQGILMMIISLPLLGINTSSSSLDIYYIDYIGLLLWALGLFFETVGDFQMAIFRSNTANKGKVLKTGLWKYTRHPNYFGDSCVWWGYGVLAIAAGAYWTAIGSVIMTLLIIKVSGVSLLEKSLKDKKPEYIDYIRSTSAFLPWFPKKRK